MSHNSTNAHSIQGISNHVEESGKESMERYKRSPRVSSEAYGRHTSRDTRRRLPQYTANRSRSANRQQHRVPSRRRKNSQASAASRRALHSSNPHFRNRNEIIPNKPAKPSHDRSYRLKKYGLKGPEVTTETHGRKGRLQRPGSSRRWRKKEYFVLKVTLYIYNISRFIDFRWKRIWISLVFECHGFYYNFYYIYRRVGRCNLCNFLQLYIPITIFRFYAFSEFNINATIWLLQVTAFRSGCGGEVDDAVGKFASPDYPNKTSEKGSCSWRFKVRTTYVLHSA